MAGDAYEVRLRGLPNERIPLVRQSAQADFVSVARHFNGREPYTGNAIVSSVVRNQAMTTIRMPDNTGISRPMAAATRAITR